MWPTEKSLTPTERRILMLERDLVKLKDRIARLRAKIQPREVPDQILRTSDGKAVPLSSLFGRKREMILVHNMGAECPYCTLWADGFNGVLPHLESRAAFVVESPDSPKAQKKFADMATAITNAQLMAWRLAKLKDDGHVTAQQVSMAKRHNVPLCETIEEAVETAVKLAKS